MRVAAEFEHFEDALAAHRLLIDENLDAQDIEIRSPYPLPEAPIPPTVGSLTGRHLISRMGFFNPHVEASYMQASRVETRGSLILTGHGVYNVDAEVGGDLRAQGAATVRGGTVRVGGRLLTTEIGAPGGAPVHVVLTGSAMGERLQAGVAHPGVEIVCGDRAITIESTTLNLSVGVDEDNRVVCSEDPLG